jgi:type VI secretion system protein ImpH
MDATDRRETDAVAFLAELAAAPYRFDFYQALRRLECLYREQPRWGEALRPGDERVRLGQDPELSFAPAPLSAMEYGVDGHPPRLQVRLFGLLGPNGPLPLHITEYARERLRNASDPTLSRFLDIFHHRFIALFYRAWAQAQPHVNRDRPERDRFVTYVGSFIGVSPREFHHRDSLPDVAKLFHAGTLVRHVRNAEGLRGILQHFFRVPVRIEQYVGHWMVLSARDLTLLGRQAATLGTGAVAGGRVWDRQHKFRVRIGPLTLPQYESFLPATPKPSGEGGPGSPKPSGEGGPAAPEPSGVGGAALEKLVDWVRFYGCMELDWDVNLILAKGDVPPLKLGVGRRLGWTTWLGTRRADRDADDLCLHAEAFVMPAGGSAG